MFQKAMRMHIRLLYRKMHVTFDWYEDSIYDETAASAVSFIRHSLSLKTRKFHFLQDCLSQYTQVENIEYRCGNVETVNLQRKN